MKAVRAIRRLPRPSDARLPVASASHRHRLLQSMPGSAVATSPAHFKGLEVPTTFVCEQLGSFSESRGLAIKEGYMA